MLTLRTADGLTPALMIRIAAARDASPAMAKAGEVVKNIAKRAFNNPELRPHAWPNKKDGTPATLRLNQVLARSPEVVGVTATSVTVGSDRPYANIHQFGGRTAARTITPRTGRALKFVIGGRTIFVKRVNHPGSHIPARPFFPFHADGRLTAHAAGRVEAVLERHFTGGA